MKIQANTVTQLLIICVLFVLVSGCAATNPFVEPEMKRPDMEWEETTVKEKKILKPKTQNGIYESRIVSVDDARLYARALQDAYRDAASGQVKTRVVLDAVSIAAAAAAIGIAATGGDASTAGLLGLGAGTVSLAGNRFLITTRKRIWFQGALALECVISAANNSTSVELTHILLDSSLSNLNAVNANLKSAISAFQSAKVGKPISGADDQAIADHVEAIAQTALRQGGAIYTSVNNAKTSLNTMGQVLLSKVIEIRLRVESEIAKTEPDLLSYDQALKGLLTNVPQSFLSSDELALLKSPDTTTGLKNSIAFTNAVDAAVVNARQQLEKAVSIASQARDDVVEALKSAIAAGPLQYSESLFNNCALNENIGRSPLTISPAAQLDLTPKTATIVQAIIRGGHRAYSPETNVLPTGVSVSIDATDRVSVTISATAAVAGGRIVVPIRDSQGTVANLILGFKDSSSITAATTVSGPTPQTDPNISVIQKHLAALPVNPAYALGSSGPQKDGVDGQWGDKTKAAVIRFLKDNFADLEGEQEFKNQFPGNAAGSVPDLSTRSPQQLIDLALSII